MSSHQFYVYLIEQVILCCNAIPVLNVLAVYCIKYRRVIAFFSAVMPDAAYRYSSSEIELCRLKKSIIHFQYLLKYTHFTVIVDNSALRMIYASKKESKTIQKYLEELSDYSFTIEHSPGTKMFISDYLSRFNADNIETDSIPFLTSRNNLTGNLYMNNDISGACNNIAGLPVSRAGSQLPSNTLAG